MMGLPESEAAARLSADTFHAHKQYPWRCDEVPGPPIVLRAPCREPCLAKCSLTLSNAAGAFEVIVVIRSSGGGQAEQEIVAAGIAASVGRVAAAAGADVQLVGKVGEGAAGDAVLLSLAQARVSHVAVLRDASAATQVAQGAPDPETALDRSEDEAPSERSAVAQMDAIAGPALDSGDLQLALR